MSGTSKTHVAATASVELDPGTTLGSWQLGEILGKGAMGCVYRAQHVRLGREAAIKVLNPEYVARPDVVERFFREARVVNEIDHEHIVEVTDFVEAPGLAYLVMELLDGESLRQLMQYRGRRYPPIKRILPIMRQVCEALDAAHAKGIIHRDLKPDNVFVVEREGADFAKVLDFGVARLLDHADDSASTMTGMILGTPHYMSPEQALGRGVGRDADVWAAGVVLFELLSGAVPFTAASFVELAVAIRGKAPRPLPKKTPRGERIPPWLAAVVMRCLSKQPEDRYRTMATLAAALTPPRKTSQMARNLVIAGLVALAAAGVGSAVKLAARPLRELGGAAAAAARGAVAQLSPPATSTPTSTHPGTPTKTATAPQPPAHAERAATASQPPAHPERSAAEGGAESKGGGGAEAKGTPIRRAPPPDRAPATVRHSAPAKPASQPTVELHLRSTPAGATVIRLDTGRRLGKTPLEVNVPRKAATVWIQLRLDGYLPVKFAVDLLKDGAANVTLQRAAKRAKGARRG